MRNQGFTGLLLLTLAACGDSGATSEGASASGSSDTGASAATTTAPSTAAATASEPTPTTSAADGSHSASASDTGDTSTSTTNSTQTSDSQTTTDTTLQTTATTGPISASDSDSDSQTTATTDSSSTGPACVDECDDGAIACVGDSALHTCSVGDLGCLAWSEPTACDADQTCQDGACVAGCVDACDLGAKQCSGGGVSTCSDDPQTPCTIWSDPVACAGDKVCDAGACITPPDLCLDDCVWTKQTINASVDLYSVWGSGPKAVWTVGASGTALYYNGTQWKAVDTGIGTRLECVHGSAADDVYAISYDGHIIRWDGGEWNAYANISPIWGESACLSVLAKEDLMVLVFDSNPEEVQLFRVTNGVKTKIAVADQFVFTPNGSKIRSVSLRAFSPTSVVIAADRAYRLNNGTLANMNAPNSSYGLWALAPDLIYNAGGTGGIGHRWDGNMWKIVNPGLDGYVHMFAGTAKTRIFGMGETKIGAKAAIVSFDGIGWLPAAVPADASALFASWAAPTGEVFAVGKSGTILIGK